MRAGILTFHASHNYGSMLQAFALQKTLKKLDVDSTVINFRSDIQKSLIQPPISWRHPKHALCMSLRHPRKISGLLRKFARFEKFLSHDLSVSKELRRSEEVEQHVNRANYDVILTGSDQIWNPECWDFDMVYLLAFGYEGKRVAYAPSLGSHPEAIEQGQLEKIKSALLDYDALSTREARGSRFLESHIGRKVSVVLDPTLLLDRTDYLPLLNPVPKISEPYIFYYTPREEKGTFKAALHLAKMLRMKIVVTQSDPEYQEEGVIHILDCGPREFLSVIDQAAYCIGNSFHLLAFSILFGKEFVMLSREKDSRMMNILEPLGLACRIVNPDDEFDLPGQIDYQQVNESLINLRENSIEYLKHSLFD